MFLNCEKGKVMHLGKNNQKHIYTMLDTCNNNLTTLEKTSSERDLGIIINEDLKCHQQSQTAASKGNQILSMLRRTFHRLDVNLTRLLYCSFVRPRLEFCSTVWNPNHKGDIELVEKVQRRARQKSHTKPSV